MKKLKLNLEITKTQREFIDARADEVLFGGAAGGGKSYGQLVDALLYALKYPKSRQLILRRTFPELEHSIIFTSLNLFPKDVAKYKNAIAVSASKSVGLIPSKQAFATSWVQRLNSSSVMGVEFIVYFSISENTAGEVYLATLYPRIRKMPSKKAPVLPLPFVPVI